MKSFPNHASQGDLRNMMHAYTIFFFILTYIFTLKRDLSQGPRLDATGFKYIKVSGLGDSEADLKNTTQPKWIISYFGSDVRMFSLNKSYHLAVKLVH